MRIKIKNKKAAAGEAMIMIYRILLVIIIAVVILGLSSVAYSYSLDVRDVEARIMAKDVVNCLVPNGVLNMSLINDNQKINVLDYCGIKNTARFYVNISLIDKEGNVKALLRHGDSGAMWVKKLFESRAKAKESLYFDSHNTDNIASYEQGYYEKSYYLIFILDKKVYDGKMNVEVLTEAYA